MNSSIEKAAGSIRAFVFDVDGVMTDGGLIYGPGGESKVFDVQDGQALAMARRAGYKLAILSGRSAEVVTVRAKDLAFDAVRQGSQDKRKDFMELVEGLALDASGICYIGDDLPDLAPMRLAGLSIAPANAVEEVRQQAAWVTPRSGGKGAVRDAIEAVMKAGGTWDAAVRAYLEDA